MGEDGAGGGTDGSTVPPRERSSAARLAETRNRLLDAVLESLAERGYAATSTTEVARRSGLTRGAQLHHFGTKDQMMVAAVYRIVERTDADEIIAALDQMTDGPDRLETTLAILSQLFTGPLPAAYVELWVASRNHPELADALRETDVLARGTVRAVFGTDILDRASPEFDAFLDLILYALRGMALDAHLATPSELQARSDIVLGLSTYLEAALRAPADRDD